MIWFLVHGVWPTCDIDHINGNRSDNRLHNLRLATRSQNNHNRHAPRAAIHGKGVTFHKASGRFRAYLNINHKQISFGYFDTVEEAKDAYATCAPKMLGQFHSEEATQ